MESVDTAVHLALPMGGGRHPQYGIIACLIRMSTAFVTPLQHIEGGSLVWLFACVCSAGFALASAYSWRQKVKWFARPTVRV